jgi:DNA-binding response OmpR family regulator
VIRVLLVEDSEPNRFTLASLLEDEGLEVHQAESFAAASAILGAEGVDYDLVILDENLGDGFGTQLVPKVRARVPQACVMLVSGRVEEGGFGADIGVDAILAKGSNFDDILAALRRLVSGAPQRSSHDAQWRLRGARGT